MERGASLPPKITAALAGPGACTHSSAARARCVACHEVSSSRDSRASIASLCRRIDEPADLIVFDASAALCLPPALRRVT